MFEEGKYHILIVVFVIISTTVNQNSWIYKYIEKEMYFRYLLFFITTTIFITQNVQSCLNRGGSYSTSSTSGTVGTFGNGGLNGQSVSVNVQCTNGVCTQQQNHQTFG